MLIKRKKKKGGDLEAYNMYLREAGSVLARAVDICKKEKNVAIS